MGPAIPTWLSVELAVIPVFLAFISVLVWMVRLEAQGRNNSRGVQRADDHIREGQDVKVDIGVLKNDISNIKGDIRDIKRMMIDGWSQGGRR